MGRDDQEPAFWIVRFVAPFEHPSGDIGEPAVGKPAGTEGRDVSVASHARRLDEPTTYRWRKEGGQRTELWML